MFNYLNKKVMFILNYEKLKHTTSANTSTITIIRCTVTSHCWHFSPSIWSPF